MIILYTGHRRSMQQEMKLGGWPVNMRITFPVYNSGCGSRTGALFVRAQQNRPHLPHHN